MSNGPENNNELAEFFPPISQHTPTPPIPWHKQSLPFLLIAPCIFKFSIIGIAVFIYGLVNINSDPWHKNRFLVFLVSLTALLAIAKMTSSHVIWW